MMPPIHRRLIVLVLLALLSAFAPVASPALAQTTITVTNSDNAGNGSLRQALIDAQAGTTINFANNNITWTINLLTPLPEITRNNITIDGGTGSRIILNGANIPTSSDGLVIRGASNVTIRGLVIVNFKRIVGEGIAGYGGAGIRVTGTNNGTDTTIANNNIIENNRIGTIDGNTPEPNSDYGIHIDARSTNTIIRNNQVSGNGSQGTPANIAVHQVRTPVTATSISGTRIIGNRIGTQPNNAVGINNYGDGILIGTNVSDTSIGGTGTGEGNIINGHHRSGKTAIYISAAFNYPSDNIRVQGNTIGRATGIGQNSNDVNYEGIYISRATNVLIGGSTAARNIIVGTTTHAIEVTNSNTQATISHNWIGLGSAGTPITVGNDGINIWNGAHGTVIGPSNVISSVNGSGIQLNQVNNTVIKGNYIGTNTAGTASANFTVFNWGIAIAGANNTMIGGTTTADRNVIGVNDKYGIYIQPVAADVTNTTIQNNYIGVTASGTGLLNPSYTNNSVGIGLVSSTFNNQNNKILNNTIAGLDTGVRITGNKSMNHTIQGNTFGVVTKSFRTAGIYLTNGTYGNTIGGTGNGQGNIIQYSDFYGMWVESSPNGQTRNTIVANSFRNNAWAGLNLSSATGNYISQNTTTATGGAADNGYLFQNSGSVAAPSNLATNVVGGVQRLTGNACANCDIEVFVSDTREDGEGPVYLTVGKADATGAFNIDITGCKRYITAYARAADGNTASHFARPMVDAGANSCQAPAPKIQLSAGTPASSSASPQLIAPGSSVTYNHTLTNIGTGSGTFTLSRTSSQGWASTPNPATVTLAPGASQTIQVTVNVPANAAANLNEVTVLTASVTGETPVSQTDYTRSQQVASISISPTALTSQVTPGNFADYTHTITNNGNGQDTVTLTAVKTAASATVSFPNGNSCTLAAGASCTRVVRVTIAAGSTDAVNITTVTATSQVNSSVTATATDTTQIQQVAVPQLSAGTTQTVSPPTTVQFTHTLTNVGAASGQFTASVSLSPALSGWSATVSPSTPITLAPGANQTITISVVVPAGAAVGTDVVANLTVVSSDNASAQASDTIKIALVPSFQFSAAASPTVNANPGQSVSFVHTLTNNGNGQDVFTVSMTGSSGLTNISRTPSGNITLNPGQSATVTITADVVNGALAGNQTINVTARRVATPTLDISHTDTVVVQGAAVAQLSASQTLTTTLPLPSVLTFTHTLTNVGNQSGNFTVDAMGPSGWSVTTSSPACLTGLAPSATCQFTVQVSVPAGTLAAEYPIAVSASTGGIAIMVLDYVRVLADPSLLFTSDISGSANPGEVFTYTHTLTNTGNITDTYEISLALSSGWSALAVPAIVSNLAPGASTNVAIQITAPEGVVAGTTGTITVTATSQTEPKPSSSVVDTITINAVPGASLDPTAQTLGAMPSATEDDTVVFFHTLTNTGSQILSYELSASNNPFSWTTLITPTTVGPLNPGEQAIIQVSVTVPAGTAFGEENITTLEVRAVGDSTVLASASDTTRVGPQFGAMLTPQTNAQTVLPGTTAIYTHTLRNTGANSDTFFLSSIAPNGWNTIVSPDVVVLAPNAVTEVTVQVQVPTSAISTTNALQVDIATIHVRSLGQQNAIVATGQEFTSVRHATAASLSPNRYAVAVPNQILRFRHTLSNQGNGLDTFTITATISGTNGMENWPVTVTPASRILAQGTSYGYIDITVEVPSTVLPETLGQVTVRASSSSNPTVYAQIADFIRDESADLPPELGINIYLPAVTR